MPHEVQRELVITVLLPEDQGRRGGGRPKVHRFRNQLLDLGPQLRQFRLQHDLTQAEIAQVVGARGESTVCQWERGRNVPDGVRRERVMALLGGQLWPQLRAVLVAGKGMPRCWQRAVRWYRRISRDREQREQVGVVVARGVAQLRAVDDLEGLREQYRADDGGWLRDIAGQLAAPPEPEIEVRRVELAVYGLRWLEIVHGFRFDLSQSLEQQGP
ncbi:helix-turn-helix domain-containing protein [Nitrolancea hollandica]|uniref:HTH cro/C1-type domain-containing protein n=1 Tax=Nitrolancea hollandica Lb TaxID=1129897 RepID=I4EH45_9BACT|nr:helix-turn-helix transcriptional regulator [Nitrolancea hollandica]CCF84007.1 hypothetical protein NITHO_3000001 [Nitrolancea hollandica Lb]